LAVDHPDYAGRFTTSDDCCYCSILLWICSGGPGTDPACAACEKYKGCDSCKPIIECAVGGAPEKAADNAAAFAEVTEIIAKGCGMCHGRPPALNTAEDMRTLVTGGEYLEPCATGGKLLRYIDGNNNDGLHGTLDAAQRGKIHVWVEELGAPTNSACVPGGTGDPSEAELFAQVVTALTGSCAGCHGVAPKLATEADVRALTAPVLVGCDATSTLLTFVDGNNGDSTHNISPLLEEQRALVHRWVEQAGAAMP
jgi:mono/diheme cytochrome c family protein